MAAPHVSAVAALVRGVHRFAPEEVEQILKASADDVAAPGQDGDSGYGLVNAERAVALASHRDVPRTVIASPANQTAFDQGQPIEVRGVAEAGYTLSWGEGIIPRAWNDFATGTGASDERVLGTFLVPADFTGGYFTIRLDSEQFGFHFTDYVRVFTRHSRMRPGYPMARMDAPLSGPILADLDGDRSQEIIFSGSPIDGWLEGYGDGDRHLYVFQADGTPRPGWPVEVPHPPIDPEVDETEFYGLYSRPAVADLNLDGRLEVLVAVIKTFDIFINDDTEQFGVERYLYAYDANGVLLAGFPIARRTVSYDEWIAEGTNTGMVPVLADLDGNGTQDIVSSFALTPEAWRPNGASLRGWPFQADFPGCDSLDNPPNEPDGECDGFFTESVLPAVGDLNDDDRPEVVHLKEYADPGAPVLYALTDRGALLPGWPVSLAANIFYDSPAIGNVDSDPQSEVVVLGYNVVDLDGDFNADEEHTILFIVDGSGALQAQVELPTPLVEDPVLGDVTGDGIDEIILPPVIYSERRLFAFDGEGQPISGFPVRMPGIGVSDTALLGDVSGDGVSDIIMSCTLDAGFGGGSELVAYTGAGQLVSGFPIHDREEIWSLALGDLDGNGRTDIVALTPGPDAAGNLVFRTSSWALDSPLGTPAWPLARHDAQNTGAATRGTGGTDPGPTGVPGNLSIGAYAFASSSQRAYRPRQAIDGRTDTWWQPGERDARTKTYIQVRLRTRATLDRVRIVFDGAVSKTASYQIRVRGGPRNRWSTVGTWRDPTGTATSFEMAIPETMRQGMKRVRLNASRRAMPHVTEFEVYGTPTA